MTTIAVSGKGGSDKTTIAEMIIRYLVEQEKSGAVLAVDTDPNSCLGLTPGVESEGIIWNKTTEMKISIPVCLSSGNNSNTNRTKANEKKQLKTVQNEEQTAPNEVETFGCIPYDKEVFESSSRGENVFELDKNNPACLEVVKVLKRV
ncbi:MAG: hypothetical protein JW787_14510 [Sedimentisphaerales bacterium]|nr:hypothetical protein [Sedimentisphaerales bacterium]